MMYNRFSGQYPAWIKSCNGEFVNMAFVSKIGVRQTVQTTARNEFIIYSDMGVDKLEVRLAKFEDEDMAFSALDKMVGFLPIAVLDMDLDIVSQVEKDFTP